MCDPVLVQTHKQKLLCLQDRNWVYWVNPAPPGGQQRELLMGDCHSFMEKVQKSQFGLNHTTEQEDKGGKLNMETSC